MPAGHHPRVTELAGHPVPPPHDLAAHQQAATDPGTERHQQGGVTAPRRTGDPLGVRGRGGVVLQRHRHPPPGRQPGAHVLAAPGQVRRKGDPLPRRVDEARRRDPDARRRLVAGRLQHGFDEHVLHGLGRGRPLRRRRLDAPDDPGAVGTVGQHAGEHLAPADVDADPAARHRRERSAAPIRPAELPSSAPRISASGR